MRRIIPAALFGTALWAAMAVGCLDREPAPVCPVPTEISNSQQLVSSFDGVDLLVVIDNSGSMLEEQKILATGFYTLINSLSDPVDTDETWSWPAVDNIRVAMVSSNLGLQYSGSTDGYPYGLQVSTCTDQAEAKGDDGRFLNMRVTTINPETGKIACEEGGTQCPAGWTCSGKGKCTAPGGTGGDTVNCEPALPNYAERPWAETSEATKNPALATQVACMAQQGTNGCGIEQQLEAAVKGLSRNNLQKGFMKESHLLAIIVVSDEEDCSVKEKGLWSTAQFKSGTSSGGKLNIGCNMPASNETSFLFDTSRYWDQFVKLKGNQPNAVIFAAIVGVPRPDEPGDGQSSKYLCQGTGEDIQNCFGTEDDPHDKMVFKEKTFLDPNNQEYIHFAPSCERYGEDPDNPITMARPGRRFVKVAQSFGANGYVYSICNEDWSPAMRKIAEIIAQNIGSTCYPKQLDWELLSRDEQKAAKCTGCGVAKCDVVVEFLRRGKYIENTECPANFKADPAKVVTQLDKDENGNPTMLHVFCPLPKLPSELDCAKAEDRFGGNELGWYYCEDTGPEDFDDACGDGIDNDQDGKIDCKGDGCEGCPKCGGSGVGCRAGCRYGVNITDTAREAAQGYLVSVQCLQQFSFEDENCQENTNKTCNDGLDNDGNGIWDCKDTLEDTPKGDEKLHRPDPACCPMKKGKGNKCVVSDQAIENCGGSKVVSKWPDACFAAQKKLGCVP